MPNRVFTKNLDNYILGVHSSSELLRCDLAEEGNMQVDYPEESW